MSSLDFHSEVASHGQKEIESFLGRRVGEPAPLRAVRNMLFVAGDLIDSYFAILEIHPLDYPSRMRILRMLSRQAPELPLRTVRQCYFNLKYGHELALPRKGLDLDAETVELLFEDLTQLRDILTPIVRQLTTPSDE